MRKEENMVTEVKVLGSNKLIAGIGKALVVSNIISAVTFFGMGGLIIWQVWKGNEGVKNIEKKLDINSKKQKKKG